MLEKFLACNDVLKIQICSGRNRKSGEKENDGGWKWDTYQFTFGKGSSFRVWRAGPFSCCDYHCLARPGELDEDKLATLRHTFFACLLLDRVVVGSGNGDSSAPHSGLPSWACWITNLCSFLWRNLNNILSTPMRNWTSPDLTSILAFTLFRNGRPRIRSNPKSPSMLRTTKSARTKQFRIHT